MAELLIRVGVQDAALLERVLQGPVGGRPDRVVVDAHAALEPRLAAAAKSAGVPFLIDPQTHYSQDVQHAGDSWARLPFAQPAAMTPADLMRPTAAQALAAKVIDYQVAAGASAILLPYVHIERSDGGWVQVQRELWRASLAHLESRSLRLPVIAVVALGWRLLDRNEWPAGLGRLLRTLKQVEPDEIALAASKVDAGAHPDQRLVSMIATVRRLSRVAPVIVWQQGVLGEAAVAGGAAGYECGIGWRERCDLGTAMSQHRRPPAANAYGPRPVYVSALGSSLPKRWVEALVANHRLAAELSCMDVSCCPRGRAGLLEDARPHAIRARRESLAKVSSPASAPWRWQQVANEVRSRLEISDRANAYASKSGLKINVRTDAMRAVLAVADNRRQTLGRRSAA